MTMTILTGAVLYLCIVLTGILALCIAARTPDTEEGRGPR
jgi:hypothetical protein